MNDIALASDVQSHHWMSRMLSPQSIAIVGASPRTGSMGQVALQLLQDNFYAGKIYLVNPRYEAIGEFPAYPDLHALPESPDLVLMVIGILWSPVVSSTGGGQLVIYAQSVTSYLTPPIFATFLLAVLWPGTNEQVRRVFPLLFIMANFGGISL